MVVVVELPRPTAQAIMAMRMITPTTTNQIVVLEESSDEVDDPSEESPQEDAWVVSGASVVSLAESSLDAAVVVTRLAPVSPSSLHPVAQPIVATTRNAASVSRAVRSIAAVMILSRLLGRNLHPTSGVARSRQHAAKIRALTSGSPTRIGSFPRLAAHNGLPVRLRRSGSSSTRIGWDTLPDVMRKCLCTVSRPRRAG